MNNELLETKKNVKAKELCKEFDFLKKYITWFEDVIQGIEPENIENLMLKELPENAADDPVSCFFEDNAMDYEYRVALIVFLLDYYFPELMRHFLPLFSKEESRNVIGGRLSQHIKRYEPCMRTILFLLSGKDYSKRVQYSHILESVNNELFTAGILDWKYPNESTENSPVKITENYRQALIGKKKPRLDSGDNFPASYTPTKFSFEEVILGPETIRDLEPMFAYLKVRKQIKQNPELNKLVKPCFMTVFSGFPGTGKTLAAKTIGKMHGMPTYSLELSRVVSKYLGEFEKSIDKVLTRFSGKDCILFIDEADSIFSKRLENVSDAKDKYINQEMAYLLQRLEDYDGVIILASNVANFKRQIDNAMLRRIRSIVNFSFPTYVERAKLWQNALPKSFNYEETLIEKLAQNFQLSGASIYNIVSELIISVIDKEIKEVTYDIIKPHLEADFRKRDITLKPCRDEENPQVVMTQRVGKQAMTTGKRM